MTVDEKRAAKQKRVDDAIALTEPDRVPLCPAITTFPYTQFGHTVAECVYSLDAAEDAVLKYLETYDPDAATGYSNANIGLGPILELAAPKNYRWAGAPQHWVDDNSVHQYIEFTLLLDEEFERFWTDRTGWLLNDCFPRVSGLAEPFADLQLSTMDATSPYGSLSRFFSKPEVKEMLQKMWKIQELVDARNARLKEIDQKVYDAGYPLLVGGGAGVPFDSYSDFLRGTMDGMADLYDRPEEVKKFCDEQMEKVLEMIKIQGKMNPPGKHAFMALHKGFDGFMSGEHYQEFYWSYLQRIIYALVDAGMVPYLFCEGTYNSRLSFLKEVPRGKVLYRFEKVDMAAAKKELGDVATISGGFRNYLLNHGTPEQVETEIKKLIDICAPGGGYIFDIDCGMTDAKPENVEMMVRTVKEYGKR